MYIDVQYHHHLFPEHYKTRTSSGTVHTSAKTRLTSVAIWRISMNECPFTTFRISQ